MWGRWQVIDIVWSEEMEVGKSVSCGIKLIICGVFEF